MEPNNYSNSKTEKSIKENELKVNKDITQLKRETKEEQKNLILDKCNSRVSCILKLNTINYIENEKKNKQRR